MASNSYIQRRHLRREHLGPTKRGPRKKNVAFPTKESPQNFAQPSCPRRQVHCDPQLALFLWQGQKPYHLPDRAGGDVVHGEIQLLRRVLGEKQKRGDMIQRSCGPATTQPGQKDMALASFSP